jgi:predicted DCC family thiol-disulfide oxidoreductase YuxK
MSSFIVVIDGNCQFCQFSVRILRKIISSDLTILAQHDSGVAALEKQFPSEFWSMDSIKLIKEQKVLIKSEAIAHLMREAKFIYQPLRIVFLLPKSILDRGYDWVARNRYFWNKTCSITSTADKV